MKKIINKVNDITLAIGGIFVLGIIGILLVEPAEVMSVLSYAVTAIGSLATGHALK